MSGMTKAGERPLLSISEAAVLAGLSKSVAYRLATAGSLPGLVRLPGARMLVRRRVLEAWLRGDENEFTEIDRVPPTNRNERVDRLANLTAPVERYGRGEPVVRHGGALSQSDPTS